MRPPRNLLLIFGVCVILALSIWLVTSLGWLYSQIAWSAPPFLAGLLVILLIITIAVALYAFLYYVGLFTPSGLGKLGRFARFGRAGQSSRSTQARRSLRAPVDKTDAATANLNAVRKQVSQIQDEVTRRALLSRSREIETNMARRNLQIVVFGTGSAGKTSLINALLGRVVGRVAAPMGSTQEGRVFTLELDGVGQSLEIVDTPGILEAGEAGGMRSQVARQWAAEADLLIFVVDNDLTQAEFAPLIALAEIGKRSIVAFNKSDLYLEADREEILAKLRSRLHRWIPPSDIVAIASNPPSVRIDSGEVIKPNPDIVALVQQIIAVLRAEGEDLIADNILLQSQRLGDRARKLIDAQRHRQAAKIVDRYQWIGAGAVAMTPLPVLDMLAAAAVNAQMVVEIAKVYGCELNLERGRELALSLGKTLASLGIVKGAVQLVAGALSLNVATLVVGRAIQGIVAAYLTRIAGKSFIEYFRQDQDWGDGGMTEVVQRQFQLTRKEEFLTAFVKDAFSKVVEPLKLSIEPDDLDEGPLFASDREPSVERGFDPWADDAPIAPFSPQDLDRPEPLYTDRDPIADRPAVPIPFHPDPQPRSQPSTVLPPDEENDDERYELAIIDRSEEPESNDWNRSAVRDDW
jgi:small GTP-binding protein